MMRFIFAFLVAVVSCHATIIPADRRITWDPGVRGGIPTNYTQSGSTLASSSTAAQIQTALNNAADDTYVLLGSGTFSINDVINIPDKTILRGSGVGVTILNGTNAAGNNDFFFTFDNGFDSSWGAPSRTLTSPTKGDATITTTAAHGWTTGDIVLIDQLGQASNPSVANAGSLGTATWVGRPEGVGTRCMGQWVKIQSTPTTTTATIDPPLYWTYTNTPQGCEMTGITNYSGIEDLTINNLTSDSNDIIGVFGAVNCWLKNVEMTGSWRRMIWSYGSLWMTVEHCRFTGGNPVGSDFDAQYTSDRSYSPFLGPHTTAALYYDNIFEKLTMGMALEGAISGNVIAYNLMVNIWWETTGDGPRRFGPLGHGPHPFMNLFEGNWTESRIRADEYWGTSSHQTYLRNRAAQIDRGTPAAQTWTVDIERKNQFYNFVGNILGGTTGIAAGGVDENRYELISGASAPYQDTNSTIWKIGYESLGEGSANYDAVTLTSMLRWGNWSKVTFGNAAAGVDFHYTDNVQDTGDTTIPDSYYLAGKPSNFGILEWPVYNTADAATVSMEDIPAGYRYTNGNDPPAEGSGGTTTTGKATFSGKVTF